MCCKKQRSSSESTPWDPAQWLLRSFAAVDVAVWLVQWSPRPTDMHSQKIQVNSTCLYFSNFNVSTPTVFWLVGVFLCFCFLSPKNPNKHFPRESCLLLTLHVERIVPKYSFAAKGMAGTACSQLGQWVILHYYTDLSVSEFNMCTLLPTGFCGSKRRIWQQGIEVPRPDTEINHEFKTTRNKSIVQWTEDVYIHHTACIDILNVSKNAHAILTKIIAITFIIEWKVFFSKLITSWFLKVKNTALLLFVNWFVMGKILFVLNFSTKKHR